MITLIFEYDIPVDRQAEYVRITKEKIKPLWESIGCEAYDIWQVAESETRFIKTMLFESISAMKKTLDKEEAGPVKEIFVSFSENVTRKICTRMT